MAFHPIRLLLPSQFVCVGNTMSVWLVGWLAGCLLAACLLSSSSIRLNNDRTLSAMPVMLPCLYHAVHACISDTLPVGHWADSSLPSLSLPPSQAFLTQGRWSIKQRNHQSHPPLRFATALPSALAYTRNAPVAAAVLSSSLPRFGARCIPSAYALAEHGGVACDDVEETM